jgi:microsomal epoxide hydrolase
MMSTAIEPFRIEVPDSVLDDLRERLARTRFPDQLEGVGWSYGTELGYLQELVAYWRDKFDWRAQEAQLNRFDHFKTDIDGLGIHFIHQRSKEPNAFPLVITHGWPGSVYEFTKIIPLLVDPAAHGGRAEDAFHVVCPSMPGYGFSDAPRQPGFDGRSVAEVVAKLMARLGYERYGAQGGDWGAFVTTWLAALDPEHCKGIHLNMLVALPPGPDAEKGLSPEEKQDVADVQHFQAEETGYQQIQGTKPQTLGYGLNDSPAGLAAWIVEKFRTWSDCDGDVEKRYTKDELLTNVMIYWVTQSITSSTRLYYEMRKGGRYGFDQRIDVPTGAAIFPKELYRAPRAWAEQRFNIKRWTRLESGGHFAALEEPRALVDEIRAFFREVR